MIISIKKMFLAHYHWKVCLQLPFLLCDTLCQGWRITSWSVNIQYCSQVAFWGHNSLSLSFSEGHWGSCQKVHVSMNVIPQHDSQELKWLLEWSRPESIVFIFVYGQLLFLSLDSMVLYRWERLPFSWVGKSII